MSLVPALLVCVPCALAEMFCNAAQMGRYQDDPQSQPRFAEPCDSGSPTYLHIMKECRNIVTGLLRLMRSGIYVNGEQLLSKTKVSIPCVCD